MRKQRWARPETLDAARRYNTLAWESGLKPYEMALAFCYRNWRVASTIIGVRTLEQLQQCVQAWSVQLQPDVLEGIDRIRWQIRDPAQ
jgi:aryl-alcohol dehydrogenase-like predicted oxidoreductase